MLHAYMQKRAVNFANNLMMFLQRMSQVFVQIMRLILEQEQSMSRLAYTLRIHRRVDVSH
jgi:hypothetical protein